MENYIDPYNNISQDVKVVIPFHEYSFMKQKINELEKELAESQKYREFGEFVKPYNDTIAVEILFSNEDSHCVRYTGKEEVIFRNLKKSCDNLLKENIELKEKLEKKWWQR